MNEQTIRQVVVTAPGVVEIQHAAKVKVLVTADSCPAVSAVS